MPDNDFADSFINESNKKDKSTELEVEDFENIVIDYLKTNDDINKIIIHVYATINKRKQDLNEELFILEWNPVKSNDNSNIILFVKQKTDLPTGYYYLIAKKDKTTIIAKTIIQINNKNNNNNQNNCENSVVVYNKDKENNSIESYIAEKIGNKIKKNIMESVDRTIEETFSNSKNSKNDELLIEIKKKIGALEDKILNNNDIEEQEADNENYYIEQEREASKDSLGKFMQLFRFVSENKDIVFPILSMLNPNFQKIYNNLNLSGNNNLPVNQKEIPKTEINNKKEINTIDSIPILSGLNHSKNKVNQNNKKDNFNKYRNKSEDSKYNDNNNEEKYKLLVLELITLLTQVIIENNMKLENNEITKDEIYILCSRKLTNNFFDIINKIQIDRKNIIGEIVSNPIQFIENLFSYIDEPIKKLINNFEKDTDKIKKLILNSITKAISDENN